MGSVGQLRLSGGLEELSAIICKHHPRVKTDAVAFFIFFFRMHQAPQLLSIGAKCSALALHKGPA